MLAYTHYKCYTSRLQKILLAFLTIAHALSGRQRLRRVNLSLVQCAAFPAVLRQLLDSTRSLHRLRGMGYHSRHRDCIGNLPRAFYLRDPI